MKAVFTALNSKFTHSALPVHILSKYVPEGIEAVCAEFNINQTKSHILRKLYEQKADVYLFSCYIWNIDMVLSVCSDLRKMRECIIVLGGSEVSYNPQDYTEKYADYVICGEGEGIIHEFFEKLLNGGSPADICGVYDKYKTTAGELAQKAEPDKMIFPYTEEYLAVNKDKILYYESSRGCPHRCSYCLSGSDNTVRYKDLSKTFDELMIFINAGVRQVKFIDRTFNANPKRAEDIVEFIIKNNRHTNFHFEVTAENMTGRLIELLQNAPSGMFQIEVGLQSINEDTLTAINRKNNLEKFADNIREVLKNVNVHVHADLIAGLPYEGYDSFMNGIDYLFGLKVHMLQVGVLKVLKGSSIYSCTQAYGIKYSSDIPYTALATKWLSAGDMVRIGYIEDIVERYYNSMSFYDSLEKISRYFATPHAMFEELAEYFLGKGYFDRGISKRELYEILMDFADENNIPEKGIIALDCLRFCDMNNTPHDYYPRYDKALTFELLSDDEFVNAFLPGYSGIKSKEIFKNIALYDIGENLLLMSRQKEDNILGGYSYKFIKKPQ